MGEKSVILEGVDSVESSTSLYSTVPGVTDCKPGRVKREGIKPEMMHEWLAKSNVVLRGGGVDESPHCYKRLPEVLAAHGDAIRVLHSRLWVSRWLGQTSSIPTRIETKRANGLERSWPNPLFSRPIEPYFLT